MSWGIKIDKLQGKSMSKMKTLEIPLTTGIFWSFSERMNRSGLCFMISAFFIFMLAAFWIPRLASMISELLFKL